MKKYRADNSKVSWGGQVELFHSGGFSITQKILTHYRTNDTSLAGMQDFCAGCIRICGTCNPTWHATRKVGFDQVIATQFVHSDTLRKVYPDIQHGWHMPTGEHLHDGLPGSTTIGRHHDATLRPGLTDFQGNDKDSVLPFYLQFGITVRFWRGMIYIEIKI